MYQEGEEEEEGARNWILVVLGTSISLKEKTRECSGSCLYLSG
jgi:hypothetical protein